MTDTLAWHFVAATLRDGSPIPADGDLLKFHGELAICESGLHAAERIFDALSYAPGNTICRVKCAEIGERQDDKFVCAERTILWRIDGEQILRQFARRVALDVIHLWDAPAIVRQYLETGDKAIRDAARDAAMAAAKDAAWDAAMAAAWAAAWAAARTAALDKYNGWLTEMVEAVHAAESAT